MRDWTDGRPRSLRSYITVLDRGLSGLVKDPAHSQALFSVQGESRPKSESTGFQAAHQTTRFRSSDGSARFWRAPAWCNPQHTKLWCRGREAPFPQRLRISALGKDRQQKRSGACDGPLIRAVLSRKTQRKGWREKSTIAALILSKPSVQISLSGRPIRAARDMPSGHHNYAIYGREAVG